MNEGAIIARTGFLTALISYGVFAFAEYVRPGFVSHVFSVHWFLFAVSVFGVWWVFAHKDQEPVTRAGKIAGVLAKTITGSVLLFLVWKEGEAFGDLRIFLALCIALIPFLFERLLQERQQ